MSLILDRRIYFLSSLTNLIPDCPLRVLSGAHLRGVRALGRRASAGARAEAGRPGRGRHGAEQEGIPRASCAVEG